MVGTMIGDRMSAFSSDRPRHAGLTRTSDAIVPIAVASTVTSTPIFTLRTVASRHAWLAQ